MKYALFTIAALGVPPLAFLLAANTRLMRYVVMAIMVSLWQYQSTAINFLSHEDYHGSARGMEVSLIYLLALALLLAGVFKGKVKKFLPETGYKLYALYFLLCLPSISNAENGLLCWLELWKMIMLYIFYLSVYAFLRTTNDIKSMLSAFLFLIFANFFPVVSQHLSARYQAHGLFAHWNCMAMALHLFGTMLFARFLTNGLRTMFDKVCFAGFCITILSTMWSYSRGAFLVMPLSYGLTALACMVYAEKKRDFFKRMIPIAAVAALGIVAILPRVIDRFLNAPQSSSDTRVELAHCAWEMIKDKPMSGVGINNWSLKMSPDYPYQALASDTMGYELAYVGIVETVYLLVGAECGIPALLAMIVWFLWYLYLCVRLLRRLKGTPWFFIPAGLLGGLTANYLQSFLEWVLRQQMNLVCLLFMYATLSYLATDWQRLTKEWRQKQS